MTPIFGEEKFFLKIGESSLLRHPVLENFDEIALSPTVKAMQAVLCFTR